MPEIKTKATDASIDNFLNSIENSVRQKDARQVCALMSHITSQPPRMWGESIVGFDAYSYEQRDGTKATWPMVGFSPRKASLTVYIMPGFAAFGDRLAKLGPHTVSKSCLYLKNLAKVDVSILESIIRDSYEQMRAKYRS